MVKRQHGRTRGRAQGRQGESTARRERRTTITPDTPYGACSERLTAFGGLLALVKFLDLLGFEQAFAAHYVHPTREPKLGGYRMVLGMLMLLFIGFQRLGHFTYVRTDAMVCGILRVGVLPAVSTFWRYLTSRGIVQSASLLRLGAALRARVWAVCAYAPRRVTVNIDTTVATVYGTIEGSRKGHNTKHRGKKGLRPVLCFLDETREYLCGTQRRGETIRNEEVARHIQQFRTQLPVCVREVHVRGDGEFIGWESVQACLAEGFRFTFGNKRCDPPFPEDGWTRHGHDEYNECRYQPMGWKQPCRFVAMRIRKDQRGNQQLKLLDSENYVYRVFVTNEPARPHRVIAAYDQRADVENLIGEAQREGVLAIPSKRFPGLSGPTANGGAGGGVTGRCRAKNFLHATESRRIPGGRNQDRVRNQHSGAKFRDYLLEHRLIESQIGHKLFQFRVLLVQLAQPAKFCHPEAAILLQPEMRWQLSTPIIAAAKCHVLPEITRSISSRIWLPEVCVGRSRSASRRRWRRHRRGSRSETESARTRGSLAESLS